jgi:hypothetical protein
MKKLAIPNADSGVQNFRNLKVECSTLPNSLTGRQRALLSAQSGTKLPFREGHF